LQKCHARQTIIGSHPFNGRTMAQVPHLLGNLTHQTMRGFTRNCPFRGTTAAEVAHHLKKFMTQTIRVVQMPLPYVFLDDAL
jgi:hypothetical protein